MTISNGNSFDATIEGAVRFGPGMHLLDTGRAQAIQKLGNAL
jgi:hypothetical protein